MTTIGDIPDDPKFTIKTVATQTGIRPVTLRAWERRHEVLTPHRSDNHYRLYSERDVAILRWLKSRIDEGVAISSAVVEMRSMVHDNIWPEAVPTAPSLVRVQPTQKPEVYARQLFQALIKHDETAASDLLKEIHNSFDLLTIFERIYSPTLVAIGDAWFRDEIRITTEHFASAYLRGKLLSLFQAYPTRRNAPYIMIGAAPTELHEMGALMMAVLLRSNGYRVEYLGPDLPIEDLVDYARYEHPAMIILSACTEEAARELRHAQDKISKVKPLPFFGYGGLAFDTNPALVKEIPGRYLGEGYGKAVDVVQSLLKEKIKA